MGSSALDFDFISNTLKRNAELIQLLVDKISKMQAQWKPAEKRWSILEVINHLYDEEKDDFRKRIDLTLNKPGELWPAIDPETWAKQRKYNKRDLSQSLENFIRERNISIQWLQNIDKINWQSSYSHPKAGNLSVGDLLVSWLTHDLLHIRQLSNLHIDYLKKTAYPYSTDYALP
jgi:hypothetical protein